MFELLKNTALRVSPVVAALAMAACGGGGGSSGGGGEPVAVATTVKPGAFVTEIRYESGGVDEAITLLSPTGKFVTIVSEIDGTFGTLTFRSNNTFTGVGSSVFLDEVWESVNGSLEGRVISSESLTATATSPGFTSGSSFVRENTYSDLGVTLEAISGTYVMVDTTSTTVTITSDGAITGQDDSGCTFNGSVTIPDPRYNVFETVFSAANCGDIPGGASGALRDGEYQALGAYDPDLLELELAGTDGDVVALFIGSK
ncbi:hypothetical protein [Allohahella marinimesophila]|uniref:Lipoprotein n=1 Tax=Allohahella marinimesophila TaxID=1054972 RepID=A0ABP7Q3Q1_9GAMM